MNLYTNIKDGHRIIVERITTHDVFFLKAEDTNALHTMTANKFRTEYREIKPPKVLHESGAVTEMKPMTKAHPMPIEKYMGGKSDGATNVSTHIYGNDSGGTYKAVHSTIDKDE